MREVTENKVITLNIFKKLPRLIQMIHKEISGKFRQRNITTFLLITKVFLCSFTNVKL